MGDPRSDPPYPSYLILHRTFNHTAMQEEPTVLVPVSVRHFRQILAEVVREEIVNNQNSHPEPEADKLLNMKDACHFLGLSKPTVYTLIKAKKLQPTYLAQNRLRFQKSHLLAYINSDRK